MPGHFVCIGNIQGREYGLDIIALFFRIEQGLVNCFSRMNNDLTLYLFLLLYRQLVTNRLLNN